MITARTDPVEAARDLLAGLQRGSVVVRTGPSLSCDATGGGVLDVPGVPVTVVDTTARATPTSVLIAALAGGLGARAQPIGRMRSQP